MASDNGESTGDVFLPLLAGSVAAGLGYLIGKRHSTAWTEFQKTYEEQLAHLKYNKVTKPYAFFRDLPQSEDFYVEGVLAYLFGLPNASIPMIMRCLELGLKDKYKRTEGKDPPARLTDLIDWSEVILGRRKELAHGFRILRNMIHGDTAAREQDASETIRHVTTILNLLYPFGTLTHSRQCGRCGFQDTYQHHAGELYLGNDIGLECTGCRAMSTVTILFQISGGRENG